MPVVVETSAGEPLTLLADIDLSLMGNYISSDMIEALDFSSPSSGRVVPIAPPNQQVAALGAQGNKVTPHAKISLDFLTGPVEALKPFTDVEFNIFDLASPSKHAPVVWQPELFLGVKFLRDAAALRLADGFAGNPALEGLPVLARNMEGYAFRASLGKEAEPHIGHREKDEL